MPANDRYVLDYPINNNEAYEILKKHLDSAAVMEISLTPKGIYIMGTHNNFRVDVRSGAVKVKSYLTNRTALFIQVPFYFLFWLISSETHRWQDEVLDKIYDTLNLHAWKYDTSSDLLDENKQDGVLSIYCTHCGKLIGDHAVFCAFCGEKI